MWNSNCNKTSSLEEENGMGKQVIRELNLSEEDGEGSLRKRHQAEIWRKKKS